MMRLVRILLAGAVLAAPVPPVRAAEDFDGMPEAPGMEETFYACAACHSIKMVTQQGLTRDGWQDVIDWMVEEQEMYPLEAAERALIVDYLATWYGTDRRARGLAQGN